jgi:hypothetical protein
LEPALLFLNNQSSDHYINGSLKLWNDLNSKRLEHD